MNNWTDQQLLREYTERHSEAAFAELVRRHVDLVYSAALRTAGGSQAEDVAQSTFIVLAREAHRLTNRAVLSGWLYTTAQYLATKVVRSEVRRRAREQEVVTMNRLPAAGSESESGSGSQHERECQSGPDWESIAPHFDQALANLGEPDRDALLLRYFERKSAREMAAILGISDSAAQKRVNRAVERLRSFLSRRGVTVGASGLVAILSANAVQAAPVGLAAAITSATALAGGALSTTTLIAATKTIAMTTIQKTLVAVTLVAVAGTGIYEAHRASVLEEKLAAVELERNALDGQVQSLQVEHDRILALAALRSETGQARGVPSELLRLRAEVARLRGDAQGREQLKAAEAGDPTGMAAKSWLSRVDQLKKRAEAVPGQQIPELQLLTEKHWLDAVKDGTRLETDAEYRQALSRLRNSAKEAFGDLARSALVKYLEANGGSLPTDWAQLKPYFDLPVDDSIFERYALLQSGRLGDVPADGFLFAEKAPPVDSEYDSFFEFNMNSTRSSSVNPTGGVIEEAARQFAAAHNGQLPTSPGQLTPYLSRPIDSAEVQRILARIPPGVTTWDQLQAVGTLPK